MDIGVVDSRELTGTILHVLSQSLTDLRILKIRYCPCISSEYFAGPRLSNHDDSFEPQNIQLINYSTFENSKNKIVTKLKNAKPRF